jgi:hypothetical protein
VPNHNPTIPPEKKKEDDKLKEKLYFIVELNEKKREDDKLMSPQSF